MTQTSKLRIIAGRWRGRNIEFVTADQVRPTSDRVRETLFNWLMPSIREARVLDAYAGSGALSFEALSRGASYAMAVESHRQVAAQIRKTAGDLECVSQLEVHKGSFEQCVQQYQDEAFDVIFLDPPFSVQLTQEFFTMLCQSSCVKVGTLIYLEQGKDCCPEQWVSSLTLQKEKKAGDVITKLYQVGE